MLQKQAEGEGTENADGHGELYRDAQNGQNQNRSRGQKSQGRELKHPAKQLRQRHAFSTARLAQAKKCIDGAAEKERNQGTAQHVADIVKNTGLCQLGHQQRAGGDGGAAVPKIGTGEDRPADQTGVDPHGGAHGCTDDPHGGGCAERGAGQQGQKAVEKKAHGEEDRRPDEGRHIADKNRDGSCGAPHRGHHPDEQKGKENTPDRKGTLKRHGEKRVPGVALFPAVEKKEEQAEEKRPQDGEIHQQADQQPRTKNQDDHVSFSSSARSHLRSWRR